jgi:site-specific DNA recombinase
MRAPQDLSVLQATVLNGVKANLTNPEALAEYTRAYHSRWDERQKEVRTDRDAVQRALTRATVQVDRIVNAIADGQPHKPLMEKLKRLEAERVGLAEKLRLIEGEGSVSVVSLHPVAIDKFVLNISAIYKALTASASMDPAKLTAFRSAFRNVFERIVVHPTGKRMPYEVTPNARLSAIMGVELFPKVRSTAEMLAEQGIFRTDFDDPEKSVSS